MLIYLYLVYLRTVSAFADMPTSAQELFHNDGLNDNVAKLRQEQKQLEEYENKMHNQKYSEERNNLFKSTASPNILTSEKINAEIDMKYKQYLRENLHHKSLKNLVKLGSGATGYYLNHYKHFTNLYESSIEFEEGDISNSFLKQHEREINRCFFANSIEEIKENLKKENSRFSKYCLKKFEENDTVALNMTLNLLRKAEKSSYSECCHLEMKVMINLLKNEHNVDKNTPMTSELIEDFFKTPEEYKYVDLEVKEHAPLPTKKYYKKYADHMRLLMNEHTSYSDALRRGYDREAQSELRELGIDLRDSGLTPQAIRTSLWNKEQVERIQEHKEKVQGYFLNDEKVSEAYYADVAGYIEQLSQGKDTWNTEAKDYYELVNNLVQKCFSNSLMKNIEMMLEKNQDLQSKVKRKRFFLKLKKFFFERRLLINESEDDFIER